MNRVRRWHFPDGTYADQPEEDFYAALAAEHKALADAVVAADKERAHRSAQNRDNATKRRKLDDDAPYYWLIEYLWHRDEGRASPKTLADEALARVKEYKRVTAEWISIVRRREGWPEE